MKKAMVVFGVVICAALLVNPAETFLMVGDVFGNAALAVPPLPAGLTGLLQAIDVDPGVLVLEVGRQGRLRQGSRGRRL